MKKIILASVLAAAAMSAQAASQTFCSGTAGTGASIAGATANFVKSTFTPKCSANTHVTAQDDATYYRVGSASTKGKTAWAGGTGGGAVVAAGTCGGATACAVSDATAAMTSTYASTS